MPKVNGLTRKQEIFATEYVKCGNASEAYRIAYPASLKWKDHTVHCKASLLLKNDDVMARVNIVREQVESAAVATIHECCDRLTRILRADVDDLYDPDSKSYDIHGKDSRWGVQEFTQRYDGDGVLITKVKMRDPIPAMARLSAFLGMDKPKELKIDGPIEVVVGNSLEGLD